MVRCGFARQGKSLRCAQEKVLWYELLKGVEKSQGQNILFVLGLVFLCFALLWERKLNLYARLSRGDLTPNLSNSGVKFCYQFTERFRLRWKTLIVTCQYINTEKNCNWGGGGSYRIASVSHQPTSTHWTRLIFKREEAKCSCNSSFHPLSSLDVTSVDPIPILCVMGGTKR